MLLELTVSRGRLLLENASGLTFLDHRCAAAALRVAHLFRDRPDRFGSAAGNASEHNLSHGDHIARSSGSQRNRFRTKHGVFDGLLRVASHTGKCRVTAAARYGFLR